MSKESEPGSLITVEADVEYSEIIELGTLSKRQLPEIVLSPPAEFSETQFSTYISMEEDIIHRPSTSRSHFDEEQPSTSRQGLTFHRFSTVENAEIIEYENITHGRDPSEEVNVPRFNPGVYQADVTDDILSLRTRLKIKKRRLPFIAYMFYAIEEVYQEVEKILVLDIIFLMFSIGVAILAYKKGFPLTSQEEELGCLKEVSSCAFSPIIPVITVVSGAVDAVMNMFSICAARTKKPSLKEALLDIIRVGRITLFFIHFYGLVKVYSILPPEELNRSSPEYCESGLYWVAFSFFHITFLSSIVVMCGMATAVASFYY